MANLINLPNGWSTAPTETNTVTIDTDAVVAKIATLGLTPESTAYFSDMSNWANAAAIFKSTSQMAVVNFEKGVTLATLEFPDTVRKEDFFLTAIKITDKCNGYILVPFTEEEKVQSYKLEVNSLIEGDFISTWTTELPGAIIEFGLTEGDSFEVNWGENALFTPVSMSGGVSTGNSHSYETSGTYTVTLKRVKPEDKYHRLYFKQGAEALKAIPSLGDMAWESFENSFAGAKKLVSVSGGVTSGVTNMMQMFDIPGGYSLSSIDMSTWDTSNVTTMAMMFKGFPAMVLDVSALDTSSVVDMYGMFQGAQSLDTIDIRMWDTSKVVKMSSMFFGMEFCSSILLSGINTDSLVFMNQMFYNSGSFNTIDFTGWNTSNVTTFHQMFKGCSSMSTLDLSMLDVSSVNQMSEMFYNAGSLLTLNCKTWDLSGTIVNDYIFYNMNNNLNVCCDTEDKVWFDNAGAPKTITSC